MRTFTTLGCLVLTLCAAIAVVLVGALANWIVEQVPASAWVEVFGWSPLSKVDGFRWPKG